MVIRGAVSSHGALDDSRLHTEHLYTEASSSWSIRVSLD